MVIGLALGPMGHYWYAFLDKRFPAATLAVVGKKIILDQLVAAPVLTVSFFTGSVLISLVCILD